MKIAIAQVNPQIANLQFNHSLLINYINKAKSLNADLIVFPEMSISGFPVCDLLNKKKFINDCLKEAETLANECDNIFALIGCPSLNEDNEVLNSALILHKGKISFKFDKNTFKTNDYFDQTEYFTGGDEIKFLKIGNEIIALDFDDLADNINNLPSENELSNNPTTIICMTNTLCDFEEEENRKQILRKIAQTKKANVIYINRCGAETELIFGGKSIAILPNGVLAAELSATDEDFFIFDTDAPKIQSAVKKTKIQSIHDNLVLGIRDYFTKNNLKKAVLGLSGGIDSAVVACLAAEALGSINVLGILMPSGFSSDHSVNDSHDLAKNLSIDTTTLNIENTFQSTLQTLNPVFEGTQFNIAEENIQARIRGMILMAYSNKFGNIVLNTSNKSEVAVGYGTLYGDMCGALSVIGDIYKTEVYELANYINRKGEVIPQNIITKAPSAELHPGQKDSDSLPDYSVLDKILYQYIEQDLCLEEIVKNGFEEDTVKSVIKLVESCEHKRYQAAPILRISHKPFGASRRKYLSEHLYI